MEHEPWAPVLSSSHSPTIHPSAPALHGDAHVNPPKPGAPGQLRYQRDSERLEATRSLRPRRLPWERAGSGDIPRERAGWGLREGNIPREPTGGGSGSRDIPAGTGGVGAAGAAPGAPARPQGAAPSPHPWEPRPLPAALPAGAAAAPASPPRCHLPPWPRRVAVRRPPRAARRSHGGPGGAAAFGRCGEREQRRPRARERGAARPASPPAPSSPRAAPRPEPPLRPRGCGTPGTGARWHRSLARTRGRARSRASRERTRFKRRRRGGAAVRAGVPAAPGAGAGSGVPLAGDPGLPRAARTVPDYESHAPPRGALTSDAALSLARAPGCEFLLLPRKVRMAELPPWARDPPLSIRRHPPAGGLAAVTGAARQPRGAADGPGWARGRGGTGVSPVGAGQAATGVGGRAGASRELGWDWTGEAGGAGPGNSAVPGQRRLQARGVFACPRASHRGALGCALELL